MRLKEQEQVGRDRLPMAAFRDHLRLGTGFGDEALQDPVLEATLRAAIAAIEARTGKVLLERTFLWQVHDWRDGRVQALPVAPVTAVEAITMVSRAGEQSPIDLQCVVMEPSMQRPVLRAACSRLPTIPVHGYAEVRFRAGFADEWPGLPADLGQACLLLAASFYEVRHHGMDGDGAMPLAVTSLIERYRTVRILGGSAA